MAEPELFLFKGYDDKVAMIRGMMQPMTVEMVIQEINRYVSESGGLPVGPPLGSALVPLKKWDRELAVSLVLNLMPKKPAPPPAPIGAR